jgi:hypothetical protein
MTVAERDWIDPAPEPERIAVAAALLSRNGFRPTGESGDVGRVDRHATIYRRT